MSCIKDNLYSIKNSLPENVTLVAVSKFNPAESVIEAIQAGQNIFGENRIQEAAPKFDFIRSQGFTPELHIIGSLQRNKVKEAVRISSVIQSCDREELIIEIEKQAAKIDKIIKIYLEIHTGEESKSGFTSSEEVFKVMDSFKRGLFPHVVPCGLMTMAPFTEDETAVRSSFKAVKKLQAELKEKYPDYDFSNLSMGMSGDYKIAVEEGSTMVRIGTAIFGARDYSK